MKILERLWKTNSLRLSVLVPLIFVLIFLLGSMVFFLQQSQQKGLERELAATTKEVESLFLEYREAKAKMLSLSLSTLVLNKELLSAFKARDRGRIHGLTKSYYERLRSHYHITHLHFIGPDRENILRLHPLDHGGERIDSFTMKEAEKTGREAQGIELGHLGTFTLLVATPWYDGEQLLGYVELGMEIEHMLKELQVILGSRVYAFTYKDFIQREKWEAGMRMLGRKEIWNHFPDSVIIGELPGQIQEGVAQVIAGKHPLQSSTDVHSDGKYYRVAFVPLIDATQCKIGHFAVLPDMTAKISAFQRSVLLICLFYAFVGTLLCLFFYALLGRVERKQQGLEETRREFEQGYRIIFDSVNDGILLADIETKKFSLANKAMIGMLGYAPEEISTLSVVDIHPEGDLFRVAEHFERILRNEETIEENLPVKRKDGSIFYADINASPLVLGGKSYVVGLFRDITERMKAEERIRESEARFTQVAECAGEWIWEVDSDGLYTYCSPVVENLLGYKPDEIVGRMHFYDFFLPEEREELKNAAFGMFADKKPFKGFVNVILHKNGTRITVETSGVPSLDQQGRFVGYRGTDIDITERMNADERIRRLNEELETKVLERTQQLQESEEQFRAMTGSAQDAIIMMDNHGRVSFWNEAAERIFGYSKQETIGKGVHEILAPPRYQEQYMGAFPAWRVAGEGPAVNKTVELTALRKDGSEIPIELSLASVKIKGLWNAIAVIRDISERKQTVMEIRKMNEELQQSSQQLLAAQGELIRKEKLAVLGQISGSVGHELRNPLAVMSNAVYFLQMVLTDADATTQEYLDLIKHEIDNSLRIITDLLDFARTKTPQKQLTSVRKLLNESIGRCLIPETVKLQVDIPDAFPSLRIDLMQIEQVFQNLVTNAVQAMPGGGSLRVAAYLTESGQESVQADTQQQAADVVAIMVEDTGEGIAPENMQNIFQPLFTTKAKGIGLGLVVCRNLVEINDGRIKVESEPDQGTTFTVELPIERGSL